MGGLLGVSWLLGVTLTAGGTVKSGVTEVLLLLLVERPVNS